MTPKTKRALIVVIAELFFFNIFFAYMYLYLMLAYDFKIILLLLIIIIFGAVL